ncbi:MAG: NAD(P)-dependent oxidoreductase [Aeromicrobium sp.]
MTDGGPTWVIGGRGLLGSAVVRALELQGRSVQRVTVPWSDPAATAATLNQVAARIARDDAPWQVMWCAGAAVIGATDDQLAAEHQSFSGFLDALRHQGGGSSRGSLFLASSAGGVHAGSAHPPFTEHTPPVPISAYGHGKIASEQLARRFAETGGARVVIGRIANLYGPGQDLTKAQGLISQLCRSHLSRQPLSIYVSLDTARDYIYSADAARLAIAALDRGGETAPGTVTVKIVASQQSTTIASILAELHHITRRRPHVTLGASPLARFQTKDLRFESVVWPDLDSVVTTGLPVGVFLTMEGLALTMRAATRSA